jgi:chorismate-pyruvate lyase
MIHSDKAALYCGGCQTTDAACATPTGERCGLCPLAYFYSVTLQPLPAITEVAAAELPQPYRRLLAHERDMTSTLEEHYGTRLELRALHSRTSGDVYQRKVTLLLEGRREPVEFGAITIYLAALEPEVEAAVVAAQRPLGAVLHAAGLRIVSRPKAYIRLEADGVMTNALRLPAVCTLYGRCNALFHADGRPIADIVEILAP